VVDRGELKLNIEDCKDVQENDFEMWLANWSGIGNEKSSKTREEKTQKTEMKVEDIVAFPG